MLLYYCPWIQVARSEHCNWDRQIVGSNEVAYLLEVHTLQIRKQHMLLNLSHFLKVTERVV